ncbi:heme-binding protein [Acinetobacter variabilis]|nr:heme-binding protein [Acinetobacter variabilis]QXR20384.1 heme-binding protein [Acinetobacter variabilis]
MRSRLNQRKIFLYLASLAMVSLSHAELKTAYIMDLNTANQLAENVMQTCQKASKPAAVTVLDQGGNVLASQRHESVGIHNLTASQRKAFTAYSTKTSTLDFMRHAQKNPNAQNLNTLDELLLLGGGVPVVYKNQFIGAVGVAGSGGSEQDHQCAVQGIQHTLKQL